MAAALKYNFRRTLEQCMIVALSSGRLRSTVRRNDHVVLVRRVERNLKNDRVVSPGGVGRAQLMAEAQQRNLARVPKIIDVRNVATAPASH